MKTGVPRAPPSWCRSKATFGPDIIAPGNPDGKNDVLTFPDVETEPAKSDNNIIIFNRWGQVVFEAAPYQNTWKGETKGGAELPEGTYLLCVVEKDGKKNVILMGKRLAICLGTQKHVFATQRDIIWSQAGIQIRLLCFKKIAGAVRTFPNDPGLAIRR